MFEGKQIGPFKLEKEVGAGAMGAVYRAVDTRTNQPVAIKFLAPGLGENERVFARFEREANMLKQLKHPNIVKRFATGKFQRTPFIAMEFIDGENLADYLERRGKLPWEEVVEIGKQLCSALQHAHANGIIHRDLKPSNLMMTRDGQVKLTDFGIAKDMDAEGLTSANCTVGTAAYMSPEQCRGERELTPKSDLYSVGIMFYELLTGRKPFVAENVMEMFMQHVNKPPERASRSAMDVPPWLDTLVDQLMAKKPDHRPLDAALVVTALDDVKLKIEAHSMAGMAVAGKVARKSKGKDREVAETLLRSRRKKRDRETKDGTKIFAGIGLGVLFLGLVALLVYAVWPAGDEKRFNEGVKLVQEADASIDAGEDGLAKEKQYDASAKLTRIASAGGPFAQRAKEQLDHLEAGRLYVQGSRHLADGGKDWKAAKSGGYDELIMRYPSGNKYVELALKKLEPFEAPALLKDARAVLDLKASPKELQEARKQLDNLLQRYPSSEPAKAGRLLQSERELLDLVEIKRSGGVLPGDVNRAKDVAIEAIELELDKQMDAAQAKWQELGRMDPDNVFSGPWVALAQDKLARWKKE